MCTLNDVLGLVLGYASSLTDHKGAFVISTLGLMVEVVTFKYNQWGGETTHGINQTYEFRIISITFHTDI